MPTFAEKVREVAWKITKSIFLSRLKNPVGTFPESRTYHNRPLVGYFRGWSRGEYYVSSPSPKAALPPIDLSFVLFEDEDEDEDEASHDYVPSSPTSSSSTTTSSQTPSFSTSPSLPPASSTEEGKRKKLEPADRSTDFSWPKGVRPEYLLEPSEIKITGATANCYAAGFDVAIINGPREQVVPAVSSSKS